MDSFRWLVTYSISVRGFENDLATEYSKHSRMQPFKDVKRIGIHKQRCILGAHLAMYWARHLFAGMQISRATFERKLFQIISLWKPGALSNSRFRFLFSSWGVTHNTVRKHEKILRTMTGNTIQSELSYFAPLEVEQPLVSLRDVSMICKIDA